MNRQTASDLIFQAAVSIYISRNTVSSGSSPELIDDHDISEARHAVGIANLIMREFLKGSTEA
jgi:hypothetical protein